MPKKEEEETRVLLVQRGATWTRLIIPKDARVTFGPLIPSNPLSRGDGPSGMFLRIYKTKDHQYAVIPGVKSFRDESIEMQVGTAEGWKKVTDTDLIAAGTLNEMVPNSCPNCGNLGNQLGKNNSAAQVYGHQFKCMSCGNSW